jgi:acyl-CoA thioester hydrolase
MHPAPYTRDQSFFFPLRVYYEDTDAAGVVYYANYLKFAERARTEWLRYLGFVQEKMLRDTGLGFVVSHAEIRFRAPARLDDLVWVETYLQRFSKVRMSMRQTIAVAETPCALLDVEIACVDRAFKPARLPDTLVNAMSPFLPPE